MAIEGLSLRLYFDHHVQRRFEVDLRRSGFDIATTREVGNEQASDDEQLAWATAHNRVVFTHDQRDFPRIAARWSLEHRDHAGIIVSVQPGHRMYGELLRRLLRLLDTLTADEMVNRLEWLDHRWSEPRRHNSEDK